MADVVDMSENNIEMQLQSNIFAAKKRVAEPLVACGTCFNCGDEVGVGMLFCPALGSGLSECQIDYEHRTRRNR